MSQELDAYWYGHQIEIVNKRNTQLERTNTALLGALRRIEQWEMPETEMTWDDGTLMSYGAAFGTNGERDVIRQIARAAIAEAERAGESEGEVMKPSIAKRLADGFRINTGNVWGHCEEKQRAAGRAYSCTDQTRYRCNECGCFVCARHQRQHRNQCAVKGERE